MRSWLALILIAPILAGCIGDDPAPDETPPSEEDEAPISPTYEAVSHLEGQGAMSLKFRTQPDTTCTLLMAAHHVVPNATAQGPWFQLVVNEQTVDSARGYAQGPDSTGVGLMGIDSGTTTDPVWQTALRALNTMMGYGETFTSWLGYVDIPLDKVRVELVIQSNKWLVDGGAEETEGGSMLARLGCNKPVLIDAVEEDPEALLLRYDDTRGDARATVYPALVDYRVGSFDYHTNGTEAKVVVTTRSSTGSLIATGNITGELNWDVDPVNPLAVQAQQLNGTAGDIRLQWETMGVGTLPMMFMEIWSWEPSSGYIPDTVSWPWA